MRNLIRNIKLLVFDFDGVMTDNSVYVDQDGKETVKCNRSDCLRFPELKRLGVDLMILSTEENPVVLARAKKIKIIAINGCDNKGRELLKIAGRRELSLKQIAFMGNDFNDLECLLSVGLPIMVNDSHPGLIKEMRRHRREGLDLMITKNNGGNGAVREVTDMFIEALAKCEK